MEVGKWRNSLTDSFGLFAVSVSVSVSGCRIVGLSVVSFSLWTINKIVESSESAVYSVSKVAARRTSPPCKSTTTATTYRQTYVIRRLHSFEHSYIIYFVKFSQKESSSFHIYTYYEYCITYRDYQDSIIHIFSGTKLEHIRVLHSSNYFQTHDDPPHVGGRSNGHTAKYLNPLYLTQWRCLFYYVT